MTSIIKTHDSSTPSYPMEACKVRRGSFSQIPLEIQEMIFKATNITEWNESTAGNMCLVHTSWANQIPHAVFDRGENRDQIVESLLWKAENNFTKIGRAQHIQSIAYKIKKLTIHGFNTFTDDHLCILFDIFYNLQAVTIGTSRQLTSAGVVKALIKAKHLKAFRLRCEMNNEGLAVIAKSFPNIEGVDLTLCRGITEEGLKLFFLDGSSLSDFRFPKNISYEIFCNNLQKESYPMLSSLDLSRIDNFDHHLFDRMRNKFPNLTALALPKDQSTNPAGISALLHCPLQYIKFSGASNTDTNLEPFIKNAIHLKALHFSNCPQLTDRLCEVIAQYRPHLKRFISSGKISNSGLRTLLSTCSSLEHLNLLESKICIDVSLAKLLTEKLLHLRELIARVEDPDSLPDRLKHFGIKHAVREQTACQTEISI